MENQVARRFLGLSQAEWRLWVKWVLVTTVLGFLGVVGLTGGVMAGVGYTSALAVVFGVLVGTAQWMLLRKRVPRAGRWVLATAVGWIVCAIVNLGAGMISRQRFGLGLVGYYAVIVVISILSAAMIGTAQWVFLRKRVHRASRWVLATAIGWGVGWGLAGVVMSSPLWRMISKPGAFAPFFATIAIAVGIAVGAITGYLLNVLLRHPISAHLEPQQKTSSG